MISSLKFFQALIIQGTGAILKSLEAAIILCFSFCGYNDGFNLSQIQQKNHQFEIYVLLLCIFWWNFSKWNPTISFIFCLYLIQKKRVSSTTRTFLLLLKKIRSKTQILISRKIAIKNRTAWNALKQRYLMIRVWNMQLCSMNNE